jgi:carbon monoxide dehydrogenase subunit G
MRITETFVVQAAPEVVFDYMTDPANLASWQTTKTLVEPLTDGPTRQGSRVRERTKPPGAREFEQVVEFTEFDRPRRFHVHVVEGAYPIDGTWSLEPRADGTEVTFVAEGELRGWMRHVAPVAQRVIARQFAEYHRNLCRNLAQAATL